MLAKARNAVLLVLALAASLKIGWILVQPLVPILVVLACIVGIYSVLIRRNT